MNKEKLAEERSLLLHISIAEKLRKNPDLWNVPKNNLNRWKKQMGNLPPALIEWEKLFDKCSTDELYKIMVGIYEKAAQLRSSSPFTGILTQEERLQIFSKKHD